MSFTIYQLVHENIIRDITNPAPGPPATKQTLSGILESPFRYAAVCCGFIASSIFMSFLGTLSGL